MTTDSAAYLIDLHQLLDRHFDLEEFRTLCVALDVKYDNLRGEGLSARMRELVLLLWRDGRLPHLVAEARKKRPHISWPDVPQDLPPPGPDFPPAPRLPYEPECVLIPAGPFLMGCDADPLAAPRHTVDLPAYWIGVYPVTNAQYAHFIWKTKRVAGKELLWLGNTPAPGQERRPVAGVSWCDALAYCDWLSAQTGRRYALPSEAQWEKAARGADGRLYPWGDAWDPDRCNSDPDGLTAVDAFPAQSAYGCYDMAGNAREWTTTLWGIKPGEPEERYRYPWANDGRDDLTAPPTTRRVFRGGRGDAPAAYRCSARGAYLPQKSGPPNQRHGFRVILLPAERMDTR